MNRPTETTLPEESARLFARWSPEHEVARDELQAMVGQGYRGIRITTPVWFDECADGGAHFLTLLREAAAAGLRVRWQGGVGTVPVGLIRHLSPPYDGGRFAWRRPGPRGLTVRHGPGFLVVEDLRAGRLRRGTIDAADPRFELLATGAQSGPEVGSVQRYRPLLDDGLALVAGGRVVTLPMHRRHRRPGWPPGRRAG